MKMKKRSNLMSMDLNSFNLGFIDGYNPALLERIVFNFTHKKMKNISHLSNITQKMQNLNLNDQTKNVIIESVHVEWKKKDIKDRFPSVKEIMFLGFEKKSQGIETKAPTLLKGCPHGHGGRRPSVRKTETHFFTLS